MKKLYLLILCLFCMTTSPLSAQECKLCGDWVGRYQDYYHHNTRSDGDRDFRSGKVTKYIRIKKYGSEYKIRIKWTHEDSDIPTRYDEDEFEIINVTDTSIYWKATSRLSVFYDEIGNDIIESYQRIVKYYLITYHSGYIHYKIVDACFMIYDKNKNYLSAESQKVQEIYMNAMASDVCYNLDLYKEDDDW